MAGVSGIVERDPATVFYCDGATPTAAELAVDLSGQQTNFGTGGIGIVENNSARCNLSTQGAWEFEIDGANTSNSYIYYYRNGTTDQIAVQLLTGFVLRVIINSAIGTQITLSNSSATLRTILIQLAMEPNPFTTGASNAKRYELTAYQPAFASIQRTIFGGAAPGALLGSANMVATGTGIALRAARIAKRHHSVAEWRASWGI